MKNLSNCLLKENNQILECTDFTKYNEYENKLYEIFLNLYEQNGMFYKNIPVKMKHYPPDYGEKSGFYHLICENYQHTGDESDRKPNLKRCERIKWPIKIINNCSETCNNLLIWENERHGKQNILLFCPELDYLVVLSKRNDYVLLTTAYPVEYSHRKNKLIKEYKEYHKNK